LIIKSIIDKKGRNIVVMDFKKILNPPCSFFIICSSSSKRQINAIGNNIEKLLLKKINLKAWSQEGKMSNWRLMDYADVVVHILQDETREHYKIEELWGDAIITKIE